MTVFIATDSTYVITEAKYLLDNTDLSIKEIATKLNFPTQSFFGKYFKQYVGISPRISEQEDRLVAFLSQQNKLMNYFRSKPSKTACLTNTIFLK